MSSTACFILPRKCSNLILTTSPRHDPQSSITSKYIEGIQASFNIPHNIRPIQTNINVNSHILGYHNPNVS